MLTGLSPARNNVTILPIRRLPLHLGRGYGTIAFWRLRRSEDEAGWAVRWKDSSGDVQHK